MEVVRVGRQLRALRVRSRLRQDDVAEAARVSRSQIGRAERGQADRLRLRDLDRIATVLGGRLEVRLTWNGEALDRLLDAAHASLVDATVNFLTAAGWECAVEVSFNIWGERGSIDVLAFHPHTATVLVVEVKSVVPDVQAMLVALDRKARLAQQIANQRGWHAAHVGRLLVIAESRTSRRRIEAHSALFAAALPARGNDARAWIRRPDGRSELAGLMFLSYGRPAAPRHRVSARTRSGASPARTVRTRAELESGRPRPHGLPKSG